MGTTGAQGEKEDLPVHESESKKTMRLLQIREMHGRVLLIFEVLLKGGKVRALIDSGATGCFLSTEAANKLKLKRITKKTHSQLP